MHMYVYTTSAFQPTTPTHRHAVEKVKHFFHRLANADVGRRLCHDLSPRDTATRSSGIILLVTSVTFCGWDNLSPGAG